MITPVALRVGLRRQTPHTILRPARPANRPHSTKPDSVSSGNTHTSKTANKQSPSSQTRQESTASAAAAGGAAAGAAATSAGAGVLPWFWRRLGPITRASAWYGHAARTKPYTTQVCSSLVIYFLADSSAQYIGGKEHDVRRTGRSLLIGAIGSIPSYKWFVFLSQNFNYASRALSLAVKVGINQVVFAPLFNVYFFSMQALLVGDTLPQVWEHVKRTVPISIVNSCKVWPAVTALNFAFVPLEFRNVFAGVVAVMWQTYLIFLNRQAEDLEEAARRLEEAKPKPEPAVAAPLNRKLVT